MAPVSYMGISVRVGSSNMLKCSLCAESDTKTACALAQPQQQPISWREKVDNIGFREGSKEAERSRTSSICMFGNTRSCSYPITVCISRFEICTLAFTLACHLMLYLSVTQYPSVKTFDHGVLSACSKFTSLLEICIGWDISVARYQCWHL